MLSFFTSVLFAIVEVFLPVLSFFPSVLSVMHGWCLQAGETKAVDGELATILKTSRFQRHFKFEPKQEQPSVLEVSASFTGKPGDRSLNLILACNGAISQICSSKTYSDGNKSTHKHCHVAKKLVQ